MSSDLDFDCPQPFNCEIAGSREQPGRKVEVTVAFAPPMPLPQARPRQPMRNVSLYDFSAPQPFNVDLSAPEAADAIGNTGAVTATVPYPMPAPQDAFGNEIHYPRPYGVRPMRLRR